MKDLATSMHDGTALELTSEAAAPERTSEVRVRTDRRSPALGVGQWLRRERELRQISLEELVQTTRIPLRMLQFLEEDRFEMLPGDVFARGFLKAYARAVGVPEAEVIERFARSKAPTEILAAAPVTALGPPERGRRFGVAIAVVILLILFTLALSIVLRPRHRNAPVELSAVSTSPLESLRS